MPYTDSSDSNAVAYQMTFDAALNNSDTQTCIELHRDSLTTSPAATGRPEPERTTVDDIPAVELMLTKMIAGLEQGWLPRHYMPSIIAGYIRTIDRDQRYRAAFALQVCFDIDVLQFTHQEINRDNQQQPIPHAEPARRARPAGRHRRESVELA